MGNENFARLSEYVRTKGLEYFLTPSKQVVAAFTGTIYDKYGDINLNLLYRLVGQAI